MDRLLERGVRGLNGFDSYAQWLGIPTADRPLNHYELLGLTTGESDSVRIRAATIERSAHVRRYCLGPHGDEATRLLGELGAAFACLSDPVAKAAYDLRLGVAEASDSSADMAPPAVRHFEKPDEEIPPRQAAAGAKKTLAMARSFVWLRRRRSVASSGPARFALAAALFLATICGVVWSARRLPREADLRPTVIEPPLVAVAPAGALNRDGPSDRGQPPPAVSAESTTAGPNAAIGNSEAADTAQPEDDLPAVGPLVGKYEVIGNGGVESAPNVQSFDAPETANPFVAVPKNTDSALAASEVSDDEQADSAKTNSPATTEQQGAARVLPPETVWRLSNGDGPEDLEVSFESPVDVAHIELVEPSSPAMIDRAVIESEDGAKAEIKPVFVFFHDGIRRWSFGSTRRAGTTRLLIRFRPTEDGIVELAGVAVLDRMGKVLFPDLVRAVRGPAKNNKAESAAAEPAEVYDELAAEDLLKNAKKRNSLNFYLTVVKRFPNTDAGAEAASELLKIIQSEPAQGATRHNVMEALNGLKIRQRNSKAAKALPDDF